MWKWLEKVIGIHEGPLVLTKEVKPKRARTKKGRYRQIIRFKYNF